LTKPHIKHQQDQPGQSPPHEAIRVIKILRTLTAGSKNTMAIYRELKKDAGFRNPHSFYRQFRFCLRHHLIELRKVKKKWGIPTKIYQLTEKGEGLLELFRDRTKLF
jgi:DNA-binding PadR family transcriptional regulator